MDETAKLVEELEKIRQQFGENSKQYAAGLEKLRKKIDSVIDSFEYAQRSLKAYEKESAKGRAGWKATEAQSKQLANSLAGVKTQLEDVIDALEEEEKELLKSKNVKEQIRVADELTHKRRLLQEVETARVINETNAGLRKFGKDLVSTGAATLGKTIDNIAGNAGAIETGNEILKTGIDVAGQAVSGAGKGLAAYGSILSTSTNRSEEHTSELQSQ